jgi:beta-phosphoglucomutase-like phosphatase (HAD superfamily)
MPLQGFIFDLDGVLTDTAADGYSVVWPKPAPELFVYAAGLLRVCVDACVVFEDTTVDEVTLPDILQRLTPVHSGG